MVNIYLNQVTQSTSIATTGRIAFVGNHKLGGFKVKVRPIPEHKTADLDLHRLCIEEWMMSTTMRDFSEGDSLFYRQPLPCH